MSRSQNHQQAAGLGIHALVESAQNLTIEAAHLLDVAVDLSENTRTDSGLKSVIRAAREYVRQAADLAERAEVMTPRDSTNA